MGRLRLILQIEWFGEVTDFLVFFDCPKGAQRLSNGNLTGGMLTDRLEERARFIVSISHLCAFIIRTNHHNIYMERHLNSVGLKLAKSLPN